MKRIQLGLLFGLSIFFISACSSGPQVRQEAYARLKNSRVFEYDFPAVWHAIEDTVRNWKVTSRDPDEVDAKEMRHLRHRTLKTAWMITRSTEKYIEYRVNDLPRKTYLQMRLRYAIDASSVLGGVEVTVKPEEQIEKLSDTGVSEGWDSVEQADRSRASGLLDQISTALLAAP